MLVGLLHLTAHAEFVTHAYGNGDRYIGNVEEGERHGCGIYIWNSGDWYSGQFINSKRTGFGHDFLRFTGGSMHYLGEMVDGNMHGYGVLYLEIGLRYEGQFRDDTMAGYGAVYKLNGAREVGQFSNGTLIKSEPINSYHLVRAITAAAQAANACPVSR